MFVYMDIESQSAANIKQVGAKAYIRDPSTRLLSAVFRCGDRWAVWIPPGRTPPGYNAPTSEGVPDVVRSWIDAGCTFVAHNAEGFDRPFWDRHVGVPVPWVDTVPLCRHAGLPAGLDAASKAVGGTGKADDNAMRLLTTVKGGRYPVGTAPLWDALIAYNIQDVRAVEHLHRYLLNVPMTALERATLAVSDRINARGTQVDLPLARRLRDAWAQGKADAADRIADLTDGRLTAANIGSVKQVKAYLSSIGLAVDSLDKRTVDQILENPADFIDDVEAPPAVLALAVLAERQNAVRATVGKLDRVFTAVDPDGRVRDQIVYHGAHTGRFSGRELQPHNFPRGVACDVAGLVTADPLLPAVKAESERLIAAAKTPADRRAATPAGVLNTLTRSILRGPNLVVADYAAVEARAVAWFARSDAMLAAFSDPARDVYCDMAAKLFGRKVTKADKQERFIGKQIVLGCSYGLGAEKFDANCKVYLVDLPAAGVTAKECVDTYRKGYAEVPALWRAYHDAATYAVRTGKSVNAGRCTFSAAGSWLCVRLPSGRVLRYRNARIEDRPPKWKPDGKPIPQVLYDGAYFTKALYGGMLAENICQAHCRDLLCDALVRLDPLYPCVLHVHDEGVFESDALHPICKAMSTAPAWSAGFPLGVEGHCWPVYAKYPPKDAPHAVYLNGQAV